jgi:hypothetical protein
MLSKTLIAVNTNVKKWSGNGESNAGYNVPSVGCDHYTIPRGAGCANRTRVPRLQGEDSPTELNRHVKIWGQNRESNPDRTLTMRVLCQLSYSGLGPMGGIEPP